ncbi:MAG: WsbD [Parcubacteria group bacterium GW2011_GWE2_39_37]|uniref:WsbD n=1 Tax=Candidatus Falkowbacteria bacterium GW2011_GWF2_39_8 TaxID=1618642 RepID=A0A0G0PZW2_9BACT|nr:MAG: WsbD [Parcubacteria group bacterium GW2011_GWE2_39_37]KKR33458.1 MAG: WsbD [Candidatus Falkowbacteria bacterium GW2011_GWF2_39_8]
MKLSVIIINFNTPEMTIRAIETFKKNIQDSDFEIILIDNNSERKISSSEIERLNVRYIENKDNLGFAKAVNQGIKFTKGQYLLLLNSDVLVKPGAIKQMIDYLEAHLDAGLIGPSFFYPNGQNQPSAGFFPNLFREIMSFSMVAKIMNAGTLIYKNFFTKRFFKQTCEVDWLSGGCLLIRRQVVEEIGLLDVNYFFGVEDLDFCFRAKQRNWKVIFFPQAEIIHYHGFSSGGRRSTLSLKFEADGMDYFLNKHFLQKKFTIKIVRMMYRSKIKILNRLFAIYKK